MFGEPLFGEEEFMPARLVDGEEEEEDEDEGEDEEEEGDDDDEGQEDQADELTDEELAEHGQPHGVVDATPKGEQQSPEIGLGVRVEVEVEPTKQASVAGAVSDTSGDDETNEPADVTAPTSAVSAHPQLAASKVGNSSPSRALPLAAVVCSPPSATASSAVPAAKVPSTATSATEWAAVATVNSSSTSEVMSPTLVTMTTYSYSTGAYAAIG
jgi:hypothetical protein